LQSSCSFSNRSFSSSQSTYTPAPAATTRLFEPLLLVLVVVASDANKNTRLKAEERTKNLTIKTEDTTKDLTLKAKDTTKDMLRNIGIRGVSREEEKEGYGGKDLQKRKVLSLEYKSEE